MEVDAEWLHPRVQAVFAQRIEKVKLADFTLVDWTQSKRPQQY